jgi:hypothetical protein
MKSRLYLFLVLPMLWACNNIEDAGPSGKDSFVKFFHGPYNYTGVEVEVLPDGYAILGNMTISEDSMAAVIIRTDKNGVQLGEPSYFPGNNAKSFEVFYNGDQVAGYMILGDSIKVDPAASRVGNIEVYSTILLKVNANGTIAKKLTLSDNSTDTARVKIDYKANSIRITNDEAIILGNFREDLSRPEKTYIAALDLDLNESWRNTYELLDAGQVDYNYVNSKSIHYSNGHIIWASAILKPSQGFNDSYLAIPYVQEESTFENFSELGETSSQLFLASDIQPARGGAIGYGVIGTRGQTDGARKNMFFARVNSQGSFISGSERYFDAALSVNGSPVTFSDSESEDQGDALTSTSDGGYALAGSTQQGTTLRNIYLVKINAFGDLQWSKTLGGEGDESVSSVREDGSSLVVCGTNDLSGLSSIFLIKTDRHGELK